MVLLIAAGVGGTIAWIIRSAQQVPQFYAEALELPAVAAAAQGDQLEREVIAVQNAIRRDEAFEFHVTADQINGWLASDLPEKHAGLLPPGVHEPRVACREGELLVGCRYDGAGIPTVVSVAARAHLVAGKDVLAIHLKQAQAGAVPLPLGQVLDELSRRAHRSDIALRWELQEGDPVALVPLRFDGEILRDKQLVVDIVEITSAGVRVAGRIIDPKKPDGEPPSKGGSPFSP
jgi:hypothetical protein